MCIFRILLLALTVKASLAFVLPEDAGSCALSVTDLSPEPLITSTNYEFLYPEPEDEYIQIDSGESIIISCPGGRLTAGSATVSDNNVEATCISGSQLNISNKVVYFDDISCSRNAFHTARYTGNTCESNGLEAEIGFIIDDDSFVRQITICFDEKNHNTLYSTYHLTKSIGHHESGVERPQFIQDDFYSDLLPTTMNSLYSRKTQRAAINGLVGLSATSTKYIDDGLDYFFSRGHLTAKADFVFAHQQTATFHYVNVAPQWQSFNGGNWNSLEMDVRDYAETLGVDLDVYTGTYGVSTLPHEETGEDVELYLFVDGDGRSVPVPEIYWKVIYNPTSKEGIAAVGINNPYQVDVAKSVICKDVSSEINWLSWKTDDLVLGYSYVCDVNDLKTTVQHLPNLNVTGLLH